MFRLTYEVTYEGDQSVDLDTLEDVVKWIEENPSRYDHSLDNVSIIEIARHVDVYELIAKHRKEQG